MSKQNEYKVSIEKMAALIINGAESAGQLPLLADLLAEVAEKLKAQLKDISAKQN